MMESVETTAVVAKGWFEEKMIQWGINDYFVRAGMTPADLFHAIAFFCAGMIVGFLCQKYLKTVLIAVVSAIVAIKLLEYNNVIVVDMAELYRLGGIPADITLESFFNNSLAWLQTHIVISVAGSLGLLIGYKVG